jgi:hypothetical protein
MKPRLAAALAALVGWYLMLPPLPNPYLWDLVTGRCPHSICCPDGDQPLAQWEVLESFDTAKQCKDERDTKRTKVMKHLGSSGRCGGTTPGLHRWKYAQCIASDDPRLMK